MICIPPLTIYRCANAHIEGIASKYSETVKMKVIQEKMSNWPENLLKISEMRGLLNPKKKDGKQLDADVHLKHVCDGHAALHMRWQWVHWWEIFL